MTTTYDFHTLSHLDFEELVRDLLQAQWGRQLENFGPGRDQGIDLRYLNGPERIIVQAKHMLRSDFPGLLRAAVKERDKVLALVPTRYLFATSVSLSPERKTKIIAAMSDVPIVMSDILGQEDLNNLLRQHSQIERQHFKLWLSSTAVLERILHSGVYNRTAAEMDIIREMVPRFVNNRSVPDAEAMLEQTGALIIAGQPGVGKTTLARMLLWLHAEQGWNIFVVDSLEEAFEVADPANKRLILFDDFLGQVRLSADHMRGIDARLPPLLSRVAAHDNLRFILTTRDYILAQARDLSARLSPGKVSAREYVLNVGKYTRSVKARILYNHLWFSKLTSEQRQGVLENDFYLEIIDHKNFNPRIIEEVTRPDYLALTERPVRETIEAVLENPAILWEHPYRRHISPEGQAMMLALFVNGRSTGLDMLRASFVRVTRALGIAHHPAAIEHSFRSTFRVLEGSVFDLVLELVRFANPGLRDFLQTVVIKDRLVPVLLPHMETSAELRELWSVFRDMELEESEGQAFAAAWTAAFDRMAMDDSVGKYELVELAVDLCERFDHEAFETRVNEALDTFEDTEADTDDVTDACAFLERSFIGGLRWELERRLRRVATRDVAQLMMTHADSLSFEDLQSLDDTLHRFGDDEELAMQASHVAMASLTRNIDGEMDHFESVEDLDEFEETLLTFMRKRNFSTDRVARDIGHRRERLYEDGRVENRRSYFSQGDREESKKGQSDREIRSIFFGLGGS